MNKPRNVLILVLVLVLVFGVAFVLYDRLGSQVQSQQLATHQSQTTEPGTTPEPQSGQQEQSPAESTQPPAMQAPDFTVYDAQGNAARLSDYFGKPIVLNFWASWCGPCQMEMPDFHEKYLELGQEIHFLMVNMTDGSRETQARAQSFIDQAGYSFPVFFDLQNDAAITYGVTSLPTTYFINAQGEPVAHAMGAIDAELLQQGIDMIR